MLQCAKVNVFQLVDNEDQMTFNRKHKPTHTAAEINDKKAQR